MKSISDAVHGTIEIGETEARVISTRAFQRLRNIKQLGLANMVFPNADYSRFSHCVGVYHVTGRIIQGLKKNNAPITEEEERHYRLAGLLHDIGHYPFSHTMEEAVKEYYQSLLVTNETDEEYPDDLTESASHLHHEAVGREVVVGDSELVQAIEEAKCDPEEIAAIFTRSKPLPYANLISSDLDADRTDYLLRTAHLTGLPYGRVDLDYLISQLRLDSEKQVCIHPKALRTADHFLLGRYFDYQQVAFHKTVAALELTLKDVLIALLKEGIISCSKRDVLAMLENGEWYEFDDTKLFGSIRRLVRSTNDDIVRLKAQSLLDRRPAKLVGAVEFLDERDSEKAEKLLLQRQLVEEHMPAWAEKFDIHPHLWKVWDRPGMVITKIHSRAPMSALETPEAEDMDKYEQTLRVWNPHTDTSRVITEERRSLMHILSTKAVYMLRVYVHLPAGRESIRQDIEAHIRDDLKNVSWS